MQRSRRGKKFFITFNKTEVHPKIWIFVEEVAASYESLPIIGRGNRDFKFPMPIFFFLFVKPILQAEPNSPPTSRKGGGQFFVNYRSCHYSRKPKQTELYLKNIINTNPHKSKT